MSSATHKSLLKWLIFGLLLALSGCASRHFVVDEGLDKDPSMTKAVAKIADSLEAMDRTQRMVIRKCMKGRGFDYFDDSSHGISPIQLYLGKASVEDNKEFRQRFGFSMILHSDATIFALRKLGRTPSSRNAEYVNRLDDASRTEYFRALRGTESGLPTERQSSSSCAASGGITYSSPAQDLLFREVSKLVQSPEVQARFKRGSSEVRALAEVYDCKRVRVVAEPGQVHRVAAYRYRRVFNQEY